MGFHDRHVSVRKTHKKLDLTHMILNREVKISDLASPDSTSGMGRYIIKTIKIVVKSLGPELERCILNLHECN